MVGAIELVRNKKSKEAFDVSERIGQRIFQNGLKKGLILRPLGNVTYLCLPLCTTKKQLKDILGKLFKIIEKLNP